MIFDRWMSTIFRINHKIVHPCDLFQTQKIGLIFLFQFGYNLRQILNWISNPFLPGRNRIFLLGSGPELTSPVNPLFRHHLFVKNTNKEVLEWESSTASRFSQVRPRRSNLFFWSFLFIAASGISHSSIFVYLQQHWPFFSICVRFRTVGRNLKSS